MASQCGHTYCHSCWRPTTMITFTKSFHFLFYMLLTKMYYHHRGCLLQTIHNCSDRCPECRATVFLLGRNHSLPRPYKFVFFFCCIGSLIVIILTLFWSINKIIHLIYDMLYIHQFIRLNANRSSFLLVFVFRHMCI